MLGEVIIQGENLLKKQNELLKNKTTHSNNQEQLNNLLSVNQINSTFVEQNTQVEQTASIENIISELDSVKLNNNLAQNSIKLNETNDAIALNNSKIDNLNEKLEKTSNTRSREKLALELRQIEKDQEQKLIELSKLNIELYSELDKINSLNSATESSSDTSYQRLLAQQREIRNSIISYNNFYSVAELLEINSKATKLEQELIAYNFKNFKSLDTNTIAAYNSQSSQTDSLNNNIAVAIDTAVNANNDQVENFNFDYQFDKTTDAKLTKLDQQIAKLNIEIEKTNTEIAGIEERMESSNKSDEYRQLQKDLEKIHAKYIKQIQTISKLEKENLELKYNFANTHYAGSVPPQNRVLPVSDSLRGLSEIDFNEAIARYDVIIKYDWNKLDDEFTKNYKSAGIYANSGLSKINIANDLVIKNDDQNPMVLAYYKTQAITDTSSLITQNNTVDTLNTADSLLTINSTQDSLQNNNIVAVDTLQTQNIVENIINNNTQDNAANNNVISVLKTENNVIDENLASLYSNEKPITTLEIVDELCYRIQIGAYNQPVNNDRFKGMSPILMESIPGSELLRYMVGLFYTFNSANTSLPKVKQLGYKDAFIVAYHKGKRVSVYEARRIESELMAQAKQDIIAIATTSDSLVNKTDSISHQNIELADVKVDSTKIELNLAKTDDIFFCVQIGVYREIVSSDRLYNLDPIMYDSYGNGLIRHTFGKYYDFNTAVIEQNKIRAMGIKDAFVIAYSNGKKIAINEAVGLLKNNVSMPNDQIVLSIPTNVPIPNVENIVNVQNVVAPPENVAKQKPEYYVQIGVFKEEINRFLKDSFLRIAGKSNLVKLKNGTTTVYRIGSFASFAQAQAMLTNAKNSGINDAFIIAIVDGKRTDLTAARKLE
jgi:hypothetical protein